MAVYLLHFDTPYKHARHYVGYASILEARLKHHRNGTGARLMQVIKEHGINWQVARIWPDADRKFERSLKNQKQTPRICPICNPNNHRIIKEK